MGINLGTSPISSIKLGADDVSKVYLGADEVWSADTPLTSPSVESFSVLTYQDVSITSFVVPAPSNITDGNLLILGVAVSGVNVSVTPPSGFSLVVGDTSSIANLGFSLFSRVADGESGDYTFTTSGAANSCVAIMANIVDGEIDVSALQLNGTASLTHTAPTVTTTEDNALVTRWCGRRRGASSSLTTPSDTIAVGYSDISGGLDRTAQGASALIQNSAGVSGTADFTTGGTSTSTSVTATVAIKPKVM